MKRINIRAVMWASLIAAAVAGVPAPATAKAKADVPFDLGAVHGYRGYSVQDSQAEKPQPAIALCPAGEFVIGGGGRIEGDRGVEAQVRLTRLQPSNVIYINGKARSGYIVNAAESTQGTLLNWRVVAWATCASRHEPFIPFSIYESGGYGTSNAVQPKVVACPRGTVVLGSGAAVEHQIGTPSPGRQVALQVARASQPGDIVRAQGHEDANGYSGKWWTNAFAVCGPRPRGYEVRFVRSTNGPSDTTQGALAVCRTGGTIGAGAAVANTAPGNVALTIADGPDPNVNVFGVRGEAREQVPTSAEWGFMVTAAICAYTGINGP